MSSRWGRTSLLTLLLLTSAATVHADMVDGFIGWSNDGAVYGYTSNNDGTEIEDVLLCLTDPGAQPPSSWPAAIPVPGQGAACVGLTFAEDGMSAGTRCDENGCEGGRERRAEVVSAVVTARPIRKGRDRKEPALVRISASDYELVVDGHRMPIRFDQGELSADDTARLVNVYVRDDRKAVAAEIAIPGAVRLFVRPVLPPPDPKAAKAANVRGLKLMRAGKRAKATAELRTALELDAKLAAARYNLACVLALAGDREGAIAALLVLDNAMIDEADFRASSLLVHGRTDPDLASIRDDARVKSTLCRAMCVEAFRSCAGECARFTDSGSCGTGCASRQDRCLAACH